MTEYTENCDVYPSDSVTAHTSGRGVWLAAESEDATVRVKLGAAKARTFARGILALADEIDGGEAPEPAPARKVKVGDKLRVTEAGVYDAEVSVGDVLTVEYVSEYGYGFETAGEGWVFEDRHIGNGLEFVDETVPAPAEEPPLKVGDRVTIVREYLDMRSDEDGRTGTLIRLDSEDEIYPYRVRTADHPRGVWVHEVRRESNPEPATALTSVASPRRLAALKEATALLGYDTPDPDAVTLARFLLED